MLYSVTLLLVVAFALPFAWLLSTSFKTGEQAWAMPPQWWPNPWVLSNYVNALKAKPFLSYFLNTMTLAVPGVLGTIFGSVLPAYGFARIRARWREPLFFLCISTMTIPFAVTMVPLFMIFRQLGWVGTYLPLIIPQFFGSAYFIFLLRQFFMTIPQELSDAARVDGCTEVEILVRIILPLSTPAIAVVGLFQFMAYWSDYLGPLIYISRESQYTIALGLNSMLGRSFGSQPNAGTPDQWTQLMAASTLATLPIVVLFFLTQRTFIEGITMTGLKG
jgi:multiple sugar transport system permease protein